VRREGAGERLGAGEQPLLHVDERQPPLPRRRRAQLGVALEPLPQHELDRLPPAQVARDGLALLPGLGVVARLCEVPGSAKAGESELHEDAARKLLDAELTQVALEPAHHDRLEVFLALDRDAAREPDRIEDLQQRAEAVRVPIVRRGAEEEAVVEAPREAANGIRDFGVGRVLARGGRRGDVGLVEDEQALARALAEVVEERVLVLGPAQERVRDDEAVVRAPGVGPEAAFLPPVADELPRHDLEAQTEAALHLALPLKAHRGGAHDEDEARLLAEDQLLKHEARLDRLAEPHIVGDEEVRARQLQRLHERRELVGHQLDARPEGGLEAGRVRRAHRAPLERV